MYYLLTFSPNLANIMLLPLWYFGVKYNFFSIAKASDYQGLLNIFIVPLFLVILNIYYITKQKVNWYVSIALILLVIVINGVIMYLSWGISTGGLLNPDSETVMVAIYVNTMLPIIIAVLGMGIFGIVKTLCQGDGSVS